MRAANSFFCAGEHVRSTSILSSSACAELVSRTVCSHISGSSGHGRAGCSNVMRSFGAPVGSSLILRSESCAVSGTFVSFWPDLIMTVHESAPGALQSTSTSMYALSPAAIGPRGYAEMRTRFLLRCGGSSHTRVRTSVSPALRMRSAQRYVRPSGSSPSSRKGGFTSNAVRLIAWSGLRGLTARAQRLARSSRLGSSTFITASTNSSYEMSPEPSTSNERKSVCSAPTGSEESP